MARIHSPLVGETRMIALRREGESGFWEHMQDYGRDIGNTYISQGIGEKDPVKTVTGAFMLPLSVLLEGPDQVWSGITGQRYEAPRGLIGRTRRDMGLLLQDIFTLHPLRAAGDVWRMATSDWILDTGDVIGNHQHGTRNQMKHARAA